MANKKQLEILKQGVGIWNRWREENPLLDIDLNEANIEGLDLSNANLVGSDFRDSKFWNVNLNNANLEGASLFGTNFIGSNLESTNLSQAIFGITVISDVDLSKTKGLEEITHLYASIISTDTIQKSKGRIPEIFLRGCGMSDLDIEYAKLGTPKLDPEQVTNITYKIQQLYVGDTVQYYSCFISYSSKDYEFAQKLHNDLQNNGVRCWFDREDIKIGDAIRPTIDRQIRLRDKLLVILSENSIQSEYVGDEVEAALEEEQKSKRLVVFPIRLDDTPLNTRDDWAAKIKRRRHIGDFSNWKDKTSYKNAFERLLRDLKATGGSVNGE